MDSIVLIAVVIWGLASGWVATWYAHRYQEETTEDGIEYAALGTAECGACGHSITLAEAMPGRLSCGSCHETLPKSWWATHLSVLLASLAMWSTFGDTYLVVPFLWLAPVLVAAATIDLRTLLIPKRLVWVGFFVGLAAITGASFAVDIPESIRDAVIGSVLFFVVLLVFNLVYPAGMGFGDVRLAVLLGLYLGWVDLRMPIYALLIASFTSAIVGLAQRYLAKADNKTGIPFGPGLALGTFVALIFYQDILGVAT